MVPKITASPIVWGKPGTLCGLTVRLTVAVVESPARSRTVTVTSYLPLVVGVHETVLALVETQPAGRFAYEYDRDPYPPLAEIVNVTFSPGERFVGDAVTDALRGGVGST
jgi:hypothetical protein